MRCAYHEKRIDKNVEEECGEFAAWILVIPHADLDGDDHGSVDEKEGARKQHACTYLFSASVAGEIQTQYLPFTNLE
jgi:hypothetical protein